MPFSHSYLNRNYFSEFITEVYVHGYAHRDSILNTNATYENSPVIIEYLTDFP